MLKMGHNYIIFYSFEGQISPIITISRSVEKITILIHDPGHFDATLQEVTEGTENCVSSHFAVKLQIDPIK